MHKVTNNKILKKQGTRALQQGGVPV